MAKTLVLYLAVAAAGGVGSVLRLLVGRLCGRYFGTGFPIGTLVINLSGSFFLGWFATYAASRMNVSDTMKIAIGVGFVGAYTTFSTFMFESNSLIASGAWIKAGINLFASLALGLIAVILGVRLAMR